MHHVPTCKVDMEMTGPQTGQCTGAAFQNNDNVITIADGPGSAASCSGVSKHLDPAATKVRSLRLGIHCSVLFQSQALLSSR